MKHRRKKAPKFGRETDQRRALMRSLARSLILHGRIQTTEAKAKALRPYVEPLVTRAKEDSVHNRRLVAARVGNDAGVVTKLFKDLGPRYKGRSGGYTRVVKMAKVGATGRTEAIIAFV